MKIRVTLTLAAIISLSSVSFSQNTNNIAQEENITTIELIQKAEVTDFNDQKVKMIYSDNKNSYFAIDNSLIDSRFVKIRILEQTYKDKTLVNIGPEIDEGYMLFLVNNNLNKSREDILKLFDSYRVTAIKEEASMNKESMKSWLENHKKFLK